jgi:hypothetical protein
LAAAVEAGCGAHFMFLMKIKTDWQFSGNDALGNKLA